ncbi:hypothetical protein QWZ13_13105 [Reinekea marina]|uniref:hypothetical protein n=1 Tax=Reinekea marina TaxID=1310421 RepID=UPI0025B3567E|nr:hypothetical protein [Reinekea marina]MDN3649851.1 hypothetical protein [Reinekea marina]
MRLLSDISTYVALRSFLWSCRIDMLTFKRLVCLYLGGVCENKLSVSGGRAFKANY